MVSQSVATRSKNLRTSLELVFFKLRSSFLAPDTAFSSLPHVERNDRPGEERQRPHGAYGPRDPQGICDDPGRKGAHGVAEIPPETVDAQGARPPRGVRRVRDGGDQRRVDHRRAKPEQDAPEKPPTEVPRREGGEDPGGLH